MKVKVGDTVYDGSLEPVMVILTDEDKANILNMPLDATRYAQWPENTFGSHEEAEQWMEMSRKILRCADCGIPYHDLGVDLVLPDQQWKAIAPDLHARGGILCANCICKRVRPFGASALLAWADDLDYALMEADT